MSGISYRAIRFIRLSDGRYLRYPWNRVKTDLGWMLELAESPTCSFGEVSGYGQSHQDGFVADDDVVRVDKIEIHKDGYEDPYYRDKYGLALIGGKLQLDVKVT